jgi:hypothetical protein
MGGMLRDRKTKEGMILKSNAEGWVFLPLERQVELGHEFVKGKVSVKHSSVERSHPTIVQVTKVRPVCF